MQTQTQAAAAAMSEAAMPGNQQSFDYMNPLFTDLYQITMTYGEWKAQRHNEPAVFEAYFRKAPFKGCHTIFAGTDEVMEFMTKFRFNEDHLAFLKT